MAAAAWGFWEYLTGFLAVICLPLLAWELWNFILRQPVVTVDRQGVSRGRKRLTWSQIKQIELDDNKQNSCASITSDRLRSC